MRKINVQASNNSWCIKVFKSYFYYYNHCFSPFPSSPPLHYLMPHFIKETVQSKSYHFLLLMWSKLYFYYLIYMFMLTECQYKPELLPISKFYNFQLIKFIICQIIEIIKIGRIMCLCNLIHLFLTIIFNIFLGIFKF